MTTVSNLNALRAFSSSPGNEIVFVQGYSTLSDGGEGAFYWDAVSIEPDNDGTIIKDVAAPIGRWKRSFNGWLNVRWFGAQGDGVNDDTNAFQKAMDESAKLAGTIYIPSSANNYMLTSLNLKSGVSIIGDSDKVILAALPSLEPGLFILDAAPVQNVVYKNLRLKANAANVAQNGMYLLAIPQTIPNYTGGVWYSVFENISINGFSGAQIFLKANDPSSPAGDLANQFLTFQNVRCFSAGTANSRSLYIEGQLGQVNFLNCQFDGAGYASNTVNIELKSSSTSNDQIFGAVNFIGCTSQSSELGVLTYFAQNINLSGCWFENLKLGIKAAGSSRIKLDGCHFANVGLNSGNGYLVNNENSYVIFSNNHIIGAHDNDLVSVTHSVGGWSIAGNYFGATGSFKSNSVTVQLAVDNNGGINAQYGRNILLNNSAVSLKTINSSLSTSEDISIRSYEAGVANSYLKVVEGGNITLPAFYNGVLILRKNDVATFTKVDLAGTWILKSINFEKRFAAAFPMDGTWFRGEVIYNSNIDLGKPIGWICISDGSPGTWVPFGYVEKKTKGVGVFDGDASSTSFIIPHNIGSIPSYYSVNAASPDAKNIDYITADALNIEIHFSTAPPVGTGNLRFSFIAIE